MFLSLGFCFPKEELMLLAGGKKIKNVYHTA
jgi:hypothetical protein